MRSRDRHSNLGLLPRMEARARKGGYTYRYHPAGGKPIPLGHDRHAALQKVLDLTGANPDSGTLNELWRLYRESPAWTRLTKATQEGYIQSSKPLLAVFGEAQPWQITPADIARYLRVERASAAVRANREVALLSNLLNLAVERGDIPANPCKQVRRNPEKPRHNAPASEVLEAFVSWVVEQSPQRRIIGAMAEFASLAGSRGIEFRELEWSQVGADQVRMLRAKQRGDRRGEVWDVVRITPAMEDLLTRLRNVRSLRDVDCVYVFPTQDNNAYSASGFKTMWNRVMTAAIADKVLTAAQRFTFHDLRSYYATQHKRRTGRLPDLHADPSTTARIYEQNKEVERSAL